MKPLSAGAALSTDAVDAIIGGFRFREHESVSKDEIRGRLSDRGYGFRTLKPEGANARILAADCAIAYRELRYHAIWAAHAVAIACTFDGKPHPDTLVGNGALPYGDLEHSSYVGAGEFIPYADLDVRGNSARVAFESSSTLNAHRESVSEGKRPDIVLVDGSLYTNLMNLRKIDPIYPENADAISAYKGVLDIGKVVGMVEDSHATDLSRELGYDYTNMLLFDVALEPGEYLVDGREGINICHMKLPGKPLPHLPAGTSRPLTVRWEFNYGGFEDDLRRLACMWLREDDVLHPQLYPLRIADYLTRKIKAGGILDEVVGVRGLALKHRELREG
ncbi:MAG: DNA double-strand break repair nuclease NurA [Candidatus Altiarchaeota archaeon]